MKIISGLFIFFLCLSGDLFGQSKSSIDSLNNVLQTDVSNNQKVDTYNALAKEYIRKDSAKTVHYTNLSIKLSTKNNYTKGLANAYYILGYANALRKNYTEAIRLLETALGIAQKSNNLKQQAKVYQILGMTYRRQSKYAKAVKYYQKALEHTNKLGDQDLIGDLNHAIGLSYYYKGDYSPSLKYYQKALEIRKAREDSKNLAKTYNNVGLVYYEQGKYSEAIKSYQASMNIKEALGDKKGVLYTYHNIGGIYLNQGDYPKALDNFLKALKLEQKLGNKDDIADTYIAIGLVYERQDKSEKALQYFQKSLTTYKQTDNKQGLLNAYSNIGGIYKSMNEDVKAQEHYEKVQMLAQEIGAQDFLAHALYKLGDLSIKKKEYTKGAKLLGKAYQLAKEIGHQVTITEVELSLGVLAYEQKQYSTSITYLSLALKNAQKIKYLEILKDAYENLTLVYEVQGRLGKALESHRMYKQIADSLLNEENVKKITRLEAQYEFDKKEDSLKSSQSKERQFFKADTERRETNQQSSYIGLALLGILLVVLLYFFWDKQKNNQKLNQVNSQLEASNEETLSINNSLQDALNLVEKQRDEMVSSIYYAQRIQQATLPDLELIKQEFPESFIYYKPRDIVSGDFYWYTKVESTPIYSQEEGFGVGRILEGFTNEKHVLVVADCTGHGVPGGFLTMLATQALINIVATKGVSSPDKILYALDELFKNLLKTNTTKIRDGMDVTIVTIDKDANEMQFAGAKNSIALIQNNEVKKIRGDVQSINGHSRKDKVRKFTLHTIDISVPTAFYLFSDGYIDQFNAGENAKKFSTRRFLDLIQENSSLPMSKQHQVLEHTMKEWMQEEEQIDDMLVVGVRIEGEVDS